MKIPSTQLLFAVLLLSTGLLASCGPNNTPPPAKEAPKPIVDPMAPASPATPAPPPAPQIKLDAFGQADWPQEIDGCACYFSTDETAFKEKSYIYVDDYQKLAFVSIGKKMIRLALSKEEETSDALMLKTFTNSLYELTIDVKNVGQVDETWQKQGIISIKPVGGTETVITVYGECGC